MEFEAPSLVSLVSGGGLVLALSQFVFSRLIKQVDILAEKIAKMEISQTRFDERIRHIDDLEDSLVHLDKRITRLEVSSKCP